MLSCVSLIKLWTDILDIKTYKKLLYSDHNNNDMIIVL
ncbi:hypothetical protein RT0685 [Rickettsia typhi str. Wilmington]|uniref:Uncharacterized protein n=1 Tax=Rickettsia typhi (strain ATCC VR-144 / Wilmington) TaxID=257363 RepID=Q68W47_RICTY|nr:hypothetical protein RT0685 [Rickettsia typhi str. Wilmington]